MSNLDKHILVDQWRPERTPTTEGCIEALNSLVDRYGTTGVAARLNVDQTSVGNWIRNRRIGNKKHCSAIMRWWGETPQDRLDDAVVYAVQALRIVQKDCTIDKNVVSIAELLKRMENCREMAGRALDYLAK